MCSVGEMNIVFVTRKYDPRRASALTHVEPYFHQALVSNGVNVVTVGPFIGHVSPIERVIQKVYVKMTRRKYLKYPLTTIRWISRKLLEIEQSIRPDLIFAVVPAPFVFYRGQAPCVLRVDSMTLCNHEQYPVFGKLALKGMAWQERRALGKCKIVVTHSEWSKRGIVSHYGLPEEKIIVLPLGAPLPESVIPREIDVREKRLAEPLRLLFNGREAYRKGLDIALEVVKILNRSGIRAVLIVCGISSDEWKEFGSSSECVEYVGFLDKGIHDSYKPM